MKGGHNSRTWPGVRKLVTLSDIHGTADALLQTLLHLQLVEEVVAFGRKHVEWKTSDVAVLIVGDLVNRSRGGRCTQFERKNEELWILLLIRYLNDTHPTMRNPIVNTIGNHCFNALRGLPAELYSSSACNSEMDDQYKYNSAAEKVNADLNLPEEVTGRQRFFLGRNQQIEIGEIARRVIEKGEWPDFPVYYRDALVVRAAAYYDEFKLLAVHGGLGDANVGDDPAMWCKKMNASARAAIRERAQSPEIDRILNDRSDVERCREFSHPYEYLVVGHTTTRRPILNCNAYRLIATDRFMNVYNKYGVGQTHVRCSVVYKDGLVKNIDARVLKSVTMCTKHNVAQHTCPECKHEPMFWRASEYFECPVAAFKKKI